MATLKADQQELRDMFINFTQQQNNNTNDNVSVPNPAHQQSSDASGTNKPADVQSTSPAKTSSENVNLYKPYPFGTHVMYKTRLFQNTGIINNYDPSTCKYTMRTKDGGMLKDLH